MQLNDILRKDFYFYFQRIFLFFHNSEAVTPSWHLECVCRHIENVNKIIINLPPRTLKSMICTLAYATWMIGVHRNKKIIIATYGEFLSMKFIRECKAILESKWYQDLFKDFKIISKTNKSIRNSQFGHILATSLNGPMTGEGCDILIVDDPHKAIHAFYPHMLNKAINWYDNTLLSRINNPDKAQIIIVMQRIHEFDLTHHILKNYNQFISLVIPAYTSKELKFSINRHQFTMKANSYLYETFCNLDLNKDIWLTQYLQNPTTKKQLIDINQITQTDVINLSYIVQSWDTAISENDHSSYSVCTIWAINQQEFVLIDFFKERVCYSDLLCYATDFANKYTNSTILIENKFTGYVLAEALERNNYFVIRCTPTGSKTQRVLLVSHLFSSIKISSNLPKELSQDFLKELQEWPHSKNDDIIDSVSQFLNHINSRINNVFA